MQLASLQVDRAVPDLGQQARFFVAVYGSPRLPRAAAWSAVRIDAATQDVSPVDARRGVPVIRRNDETRYRLIDPVNALTSRPTSTYGLLMSTPASRVLYPQPGVQPAAGGGPGQLVTDPPRVADPYALAQSSGAFPRPAFALQCKEAGAFAIGVADDWTQLVPEFSFTPPLADVAQSAEWGLARSVVGDPPGIPPSRPSSSASSSAWTRCCPTRRGTSWPSNPIRWRCGSMRSAPIRCSSSTRPSPMPAVHGPAWACPACASASRCRI